MTKTIRRPDGTVETLEGTPEEFAAFERARATPAPLGYGQPWGPATVPTYRVPRYI